MINKLQNNTGNTSFNNLIKDTPTVTNPVAVDFAAHARAQGALAETVETLEELREAFKRAKAADQTTIISIQVDPYEGWTQEGHAWWEVGLPEVSNSQNVRTAREEWEAGRINQRVGV